MTTLAFPIAVLGTLVAVGLGSLAVAALALAHVVAPWGVFFFYALPCVPFMVLALYAVMKRIDDVLRNRGSSPPSSASDPSARGS